MILRAPGLGAAGLSLNDSMQIFNFHLRKCSCTQADTKASVRRAEVMLK